jgi:hypothetical protein
VSAITERMGEPFADDDAYDDENAEALAKIRAFFGVVWQIVLHVGMPVAGVWAINASERMDLFAPFMDGAVAERLGRLGLFLGMGAAVIATESLTRVARPFGLGSFLLTAGAMAVAMLPFLAEPNDVRLGLTSGQFAVVVAYAYLVLKVGVGVIVGAVMSWVLLVHAVPSPASRVRRATPRK